MIKQLEWRKMHTEEFACYKELLEKKWQLEKGAKLVVTTEIIDSLLQNGTNQAYEEIISILFDRDFQDVYSSTEEMASVYVAMQIYDVESRFGMDHTILTNIKSVKELSLLLLRFRLLVWNFEFLNQQDLYNYIETYMLSDIAVSMLIDKYSVNKEKLRRLLLENDHE